MSFPSTIIAIHSSRIHRSLLHGPFFTTAFLQMGGTTSKPTTPSPMVDLTRGATVSLEAANQAQLEIQRQLSEATKQAAAAVSSGGWGWFMAKLFGVAALIFGLVVLYDYIATKSGAPTVPGLGPLMPNVHSAMHGTQDVTAKVTNMINTSTGVLSIPASLSTNLGITPVSPTDQLTITYQFPGNMTIYSMTYDDTSSVNISSSSNPGKPVSSGPPPTQTSAPVSTVQQPSLLSRIWAGLGGGASSGNLLSNIHDATGTGMVQSTSAPLSSQDQGAYGMQWWMFIKDWNYGYGKDKSVLTRPDPTNGSIMNPSVTLHPTDNSLKVSVSLFPSGDGASKTEPAPAGASGSSTDDVYVCEVTNLPLQTWFSVGVTVFGRNLDVYIDGKLVKSCFLPGVPKPATGDIQLSPGGGFSGYLCDFYHYARMLTPGDAMTFFSAGTGCKNKVPSDGQAPGTTAMTGYSVKFGVYDTLGKQVQEYSF
jgi:hypothetical protein